MSDLSTTPTSSEAPAPDTAPAGIEATPNAPNAEGVTDPAAAPAPAPKPEAKEDRAAARAARAAREARKAADLAKQAEEKLAAAKAIEAKFAPFAETLTKKDAKAIAKVLKDEGLLDSVFDAQLDTYLEENHTPTEIELVRKELNEVKGKLTEREKQELEAQEAAKTAQAQQTYAESLSAIEALAKTIPTLDLVVKRGQSAYHDALKRVGDTWEKAGKPQMSADEYREAVVAALETIEDEMAEFGSLYGYQRPSKAPREEKQAPQHPTAPVRTITNSLTGSTPLKQPARPMTPAEAAKAALAEAGL